MRSSRPFLLLLLVLAAACGRGGDRYTVALQPGGWMKVEQRRGPVLGYSPDSGVTLLEQDGYVFKDLDRDGVLSPYEDWRRTPESRAKDLSARLDTAGLAGLMLYSSHQSVPADTLMAAQRQFIGQGHVRHILVTAVADAATAARWSNAVQAFAEGQPLGIPVELASDPRHAAVIDGEFNAGAGGAISRWPREIGLAATFDPERVRRFGAIAAAEYRALGFTTALSPEVDLATDPRWKRFAGTFGEDPQLVTELSAAYVAGFQETPGSRDGWGGRSVNAMAKHWPGAGTGEAGRESHHWFGRWAVYPGGGFDLQLKPFLEGAFRTGTPTRRASAVMPTYNIATGQNPSGENVGANYSRYLVTDLLRERYGYDGVVCTDWNVAKDWYPAPFRWAAHAEDPAEFHGGKCWGVEDLSVEERHYRLLQAGVDQFGGGDDLAPVLAAYARWRAEAGEVSARTRFEVSAVRILRNMFQVGLFENPYLDPEASASIVGCPEYMQAGYEAQVRSIVMLKDHGAVLPMAPGAKVYVPERHQPASKKFFEGYAAEATARPIRDGMLDRYYTRVDDPVEADFALVCIKGPEGLWGHSMDDVDEGGNGYVPISLQYAPYTAVAAREESLAGGDCSYRGKTTQTYNVDDMLLVRRTHEVMGGKPVVVLLKLSRPCVLSEIEPWADALLLNFGASYQALLDVVSGTEEPSGLLPMQMPASMETVEWQAEDLPRDMECYVDADGHRYDFAFGMDWSGVIADARVKRYK